MRLPPGQIETKRFPIVGERSPAEMPSGWQLTISGLVQSPDSLEMDGLLWHEQRRLTFDIHCVTSWTRFGSSFTGVPLAELVAPSPEARFVSFGSFSERGHTTSLPVSYAMENSWVVHQFEDAPLSVEHGGPVRVVTPGKYFYKSIKWLKSIELLAEDRPGWWEVNSAYHNNADPRWGDERFTSGSVRPEQLQRFLTAGSYAKYRNRVMIGLDLSRWRPATTDLRRLYLKNCDLSGVDLSGADLREANLSLSDLRGARLIGADLSGSDLEGADFHGADLTGANLSETALSATRFQGATVAGARFEGSRGLVESEATYLESQGLDVEHG